MISIIKKFADVVRKYKEVGLYLLFGAMTTAVSILTYALFTRVVFSPYSAVQLSNVLSWIVSVSFAYITNKVFVFNSKKRVASEAFRFFFSRIGTLLLEIIIMHILVVMAGVNDMIAKIFVQIVVIIANYVLSKLLVFRK